MKRIRWAATIGAWVVALCVLFLSADYVVARIRAPKDAKLVEDLKKQVRQDSALAPKLEAEHKRITAALKQRKQRDDIMAIVLIVAAGVFIASAKWLDALPGRRPISLERLVQLKAAPVQTILRPAGSAAEPAPLDVFVKRLVELNGGSKEAAIPILQAIQTHYRYLPDEALKLVCELTDITPAQIAGTSSFYSQFRRSPMGRHLVRVCHGTACHVAGARQVTDELRRRLEIPDGADTDPERQFTVDEVACLGCCSLAPVIMVDGQTVGKLTPAGAGEALEPLRSASLT